MTASEPNDRAAAAPVVRVRNISKRFRSTIALRGVDMSVAAGEIRGVAGANGAGKSTLMKILNGVHQPDEGTIEIDGRPHLFHGPRDAQLSGIGMVFQEFSLVPQLTVAENIFLTAAAGARGGITKARLEVDRSRKLFERLGVDIDPTRRVEDLPVPQQQMSEIAKALSADRRMLILDEPTASLGRHDAQQLLNVLRRLAEDGLAILFVSHHLREVLDVCHTVTVLRDGQVTASGPVGDFTLERLVADMLGGRQVSRREPAPPAATDAPVLLRAAGIALGDRLNGVDLELRAGEVVGVAGLLGSGRTELLTCLYGYATPSAGTVRTGDGQPIRSAADGIRAGVAVVPEDRRTQGLVQQYGMRDNVALPVLDRVSRAGWYRRKQAQALSEGLAQRLQVRLTDMDQPMTDLSGGNQQKVVFAKSAAAEPKVLLLDEPTFGIDVNTSSEIMEIARDFARKGGAVVWVSSDFDELIQVANRIVVLRDGTISEEFSNSTDKPATEQQLLVAVQ